MLKYPTIDPIAFSIGPIDIHWYGLMYLFGFLLGGYYAYKRAARADSPVKQSQVEDMVFWIAMGVILGGRVGYVLFYNFDQFLDNPLWLFAVWEGGMSFHGGLLGVILALYLFGRFKANANLVQMGDFVAPMIPIGLGLGRIGNFIGQELWGRHTDAWYGMVFPKEGADALARHPSQLYQAALEGVVLGVILWWFSRKPRPTGAVSGVFLLGYGIFRFLVEFVREPDAHLGFQAFDWMTRGQQLSIPMIIAGLGFIIWAYRKPQAVSQNS